MWAQSVRRWAEPQAGGSGGPVGRPEATWRSLPIKLIDVPSVSGSGVWLRVRAPIRQACAMRGLKNGSDEKIDSVQ